MNILVSGSIAFDRIMDFPGKFSDHILPGKIHNLNVSFGLDKLSVQFGGTAGNIAYNLSLFGQRPYVISQAGTDFTTYQQWLKQHGVRVNTIRAITTDVCATAHIITDQSDNQIAGFHFGAMSQSALKDRVIKQTVKVLAKPDSIAILGAGNLTDLLELVALYKKQQVKYIFDPGQQLPWLTPEQLAIIIPAAHTLIVNDYELELVKKKLGKTAKAMLQQVRQLIVTRGSEGADWYVNGKRHRLPVAKPKRVLDPTGAGDAYRSGVILGMMYNWSPETAGRVGALVATYAIEQYGTQQHRFTVAQFKKRYQQTFKQSIKI